MKPVAVVRRPSVVAALLAACVLGACGPASEPPPRPANASAVADAFDLAALARLEDLEERSEALANRLLELSALAPEAHGRALEPFFDGTVRLALPRPGGERETAWRFIVREDWTCPSAEEITAGQAAERLAAWVGRFAEREEVRFELTRSDDVALDEGRLSGRFRAFLVGRDARGRRTWLRGSGSVRAVRRDQRWTVTELLFERASALTAERELFTEVSAPAGLSSRDPSFEERGGRALLTHGVATVDVDQDGALDVFSTSLDRNALFLRRPEGTFVDVAAEAGLATFPRPGVAPVFFDADGDGDLDLFVSAIGHQLFFVNRLAEDGRLFFRDESERAGVDVEAVGMGVAAGDVDRDGDTDVVVASYNDYGPVLPDSWDAATNGLPNRVFLNDGSGRFREAGAELGLDDSRWSYAVTLADVSGDGRLDVLVANDFGGPSGVYVARPDGRFVDEAEARGFGEPGYGMGVAVGDPDADGDLDVHVTKMSSVAGSRILARLDARRLPALERLAPLAGGNSLYENAGDGTFREVSREAGPFEAGWAWGGGFLDVDGDGFADLYSPSGFVSNRSRADTTSLFWRQVVAAHVPGGQTTDQFIARQLALLARGFSFSGHERDLLAVNRGDGTFLDVSGCSGLDDLGDGRAAALADFDDDGDVDVLLRSLHGEGLLLFRNEIGSESGFLRIALRGTDSGPDAFGAIVRIGVAGRVTAQVKSGGAGFLAQHDPRLVFGLGPAEAVDWVEVTWPSGRVDRLPGVDANQSIEIEEGAGRWTVVGDARRALPSADQPEPS